MTFPFLVSPLLAVLPPVPLCQPEPKDSPAREVVWDAYIAAFPTLEQGLPAQPDRALLMPIAGVRVSDIAGTWSASAPGSTCWARATGATTTPTWSAWPPV